RGALLPGGADQQVDVGDVGAMQVRGDGGLVDAVRVEFAGHRLGGDGLGGFGDLGATTVVDAVVDRDDVVVQGHVLGDLELLDHAAPHPGPRAHPAHPHPHRVEVLPTPAHHLAVEAHQESDFLGGAFPVLGGERVDGQVLDADFDGTAR